MFNRKILAAALAVLSVISLAACGNSEAENGENGTAANVQAQPETTAADEKTEQNTAAEENSETVDFTQNTEETSLEEQASQVQDNPSLLDAEQIVEFYKAAAKKSNPSIKSEQMITLKSINVNNGEYEGLFEFITPIMSKLLANNSKEKDGVTGGFSNLSAADVKSAKAYRMGENTVVEMVMKDQVSGAREDALTGSVGHAITAVGDIGVVIEQMKDLGLPLEISDSNTKIYYTNPTVKVLVNGRGEIVKGTWFYTVDIRLNNYKAFGKAVNTTSVVMDNEITVNGGF